MSISLVVVFPAVLVLILLTVQAALWWYDRQVALAAARQGSEAARSYLAVPADGSVAATKLLDQVGGGLTDRNISVADDGINVVVRVTVRTQSLLPFLPGLLITQQVTAPVERFVPAP